MIREVIEKNASKFPDRLAFTFYSGGQKTSETTFGQFDEFVNQFASGLSKLGLKSDDRVCVLSPNCIEFLVIYGAAEKGACVVVPLNVRLHPEELKFIIHNAGARMVIVHQSLLHLTHSIQSQLPSVEWWATIGNGTSEEQVSYQAILERGEKKYVGRAIDSEDLVYIMYTSGTTGKPKGVMVAQRSPVENARAFLIEVSTRHEQSMISSMPLYNVGGKILEFNFFVRGCHNVILDKFDPSLILDLIDCEKIEYMTAVPTMFHDFLRIIKGKNQTYDLTSLHGILYSGSPASETLLREMIEIFPNQMIQIYGMTETGTLITVLHPERHLINDKKYLTSCGVPAFGVEVKVVDEGRRQVPVGQVGEIAVKSRHLLKGYWNNEQATRDSLFDGWFYTGDMGEMDEDGYLYILDRKKDMIISGGENIYPRQVEEVLSRHPSIKEVAVIGIPDDKWGESVKAVVVLKDGAEVSEQEVIQFSTQYLGSFKKPKSVDFVDELPKNPTGKVLKHELRKKFWNGKSRLVN